MHWQRTVKVAHHAGNGRPPGAAAVTQMELVLILMTRKERVKERKEEARTRKVNLKEKVRRRKEKAERPPRDGNQPIGRRLVGTGTSGRMMDGPMTSGNREHGPPIREAKAKAKARRKRARVDEVPQRGKAKEKKKVKAAGKHRRGRRLASDIWQAHADTAKSALTEFTRQTA